MSYEEQHQKMSAMLSTAIMANRHPVRFVVGRLWDRRIKAGAPHRPVGDIKFFMDVPYRVDPEVVDGFALVVR